MSTMENKLRAGNYLTFTLNGEHLGVDALRVETIIGMQPCTPLPQAPRHVKGLTMVRGKVIPVIDTRVRLGMPPGEPTEKTCIVLLIVGSANTGIIVDEVEVVEKIEEDQFENLSEGINSDGLVGIAKVNGKVITILDIDDVTQFAG